MDGNLTQTLFTDRLLTFELELTVILILQARRLYANDTVTSIVYCQVSTARPEIICSIVELAR